MRLVIDLETRSACDLKSRGSWVYSEDSTTEVLCLGHKLEGRPADILLPKNYGTPGAIRLLFAEAAEVWAHNAMFEQAIWQNVCEKRYGWPPLPYEKLRCSAAVAAMHALPRKLESVGAALGLSIQKDAEGARIMRKLCKPRRPKKDEDPAALLWHEDPADYERLYEYCKRDCEAEEMVIKALRALPLKEIDVWRLDQIVNRRGAMVDLPSCRVMVEFIAAHESKLLARLARLTNGAVKTGRQVEVLRSYLRGLGVDLPDLSAASVAGALETCPPGQAREILEIRDSLRRSSSAKYQAMLDRAGKDSRVRDSLLYHGASTGRWAGSGIQPQNFPSRIKTSAPTEEMLEAIRVGGYDLFRALYDDDPMAAAGAITRSCIVAGEGKEFICADYSAVEGRGLAWASGEMDELALYAADVDVYVQTAAKMLKKSPALVTKDERSKLGKVSCLACGYGGGVGAVRRFGGGVDMDDDQVKEQIVTPWRETHPKTVAFWYDMEEAALDAVRNPGKMTAVRGGIVRFKNNGQFLLMRLPSGRLLYYYDPRVEDVETPWGAIKPAVTFMGVNSLTKQWERQATRGTILVENCIQAICRDLLAEAMLLLESAGYPIVLTAHDEVLSEVDEGHGSLEEFIQIMEVVPPWAAGFPVKAVGWRGRRYRK